MRPKIRSRMSRQRTWSTRGVDAERAASAIVLGHVGRVDVHLGRDAADVQAGAAEGRVLDDRDVQSSNRRPEGVARAGADDHEVEVAHPPTVLEALRDRLCPERSTVGNRPLGSEERKEKLREIGNPGRFVNDITDVCRCLTAVGGGQAGFARIRVASGPVGWVAVSVVSRRRAPPGRANNRLFVR